MTACPGLPSVHKHGRRPQRPRFVVGNTIAAMDCDATAVGSTTMRPAARALDTANTKEGGSLATRPWEGLERRSLRENSALASMLGHAYVGWWQVVCHVSEYHMRSGSEGGSMPCVIRDGVRLCYELDGAPDGPWLTLVHGQTHHAGYWDAQLADFAGYRLLRVDLRGHGQSSAPIGGYTQAHYADDTLAVLDALDVRATHLWGTHTGAAASLLLAAEHPERVASLTLEGAVIPGAPPPSVVQHLRRAGELARSDGVEAARIWWLDESGWFAALRREPRRRRWEAHRALVDAFSGAPWLDATPAPEQPNLTPRLAALRQPTLLINGANDLPDFLATAELLERTLPHARRYLIPGAGAFPAWEEPEAVNPVVLRFLEEVD